MTAHIWSGLVGPVPMWPSWPGRFSSLKLKQVEIMKDSALCAEFAKNIFLKLPHTHAHDTGIVGISDDDLAGIEW
jgi:hypothetical protein